MTDTIDRPALATVARTCEMCGDITAAADLKRRWNRVVCVFCLEELPDPKSRHLTPEMERMMRPWTPGELSRFMVLAKQACRSTDAAWGCETECGDLSTTVFCMEDARPHQRRYLIHRMWTEAWSLVRCAGSRRWIPELQAAAERREDTWSA